MCTFYALETFYTKKCGCFWQVHSRQLQHKPQQPAHTERQTKTTAAVSAGPAPQGLTCPLCAPRPAERAAARLAGQLVNGSGRVSIYSTRLYLVLICINARKLKSENP